MVHIPHWGCSRIWHRPQCYGSYEILVVKVQASTAPLCETSSFLMSFLLLLGGRDLSAVLEAGANSYAQVGSTFQSKTCPLHGAFGNCGVPLLSRNGTDH